MFSYADSKICVDKNDSNFISLHEFMVNFINSTDISWIGNPNGYIQNFSYKPFHSIMFTEIQLRYLVNKIKENKFLTLRFCSDENAIAKQNGLDGQIHYNVLCLPPESSMAALPIAEIISLMQTNISIDICFQTICKLLRIMTTNRPLAHKIETNFRILVIESLSFAFNKISLVSYLNWADSFTDRKEVSDIDVLTVFHISNEETQHVVLRRVKKCLLSEQAIYIAGLCITNMIDSDQLHDAEKIC